MGELAKLENNTVVGISCLECGEPVSVLRIDPRRCLIGDGIVKKNVGGVTPAHILFIGKRLYNRDVNEVMNDN